MTAGFLQRSTCWQFKQNVVLSSRITLLRRSLCYTRLPPFRQCSTWQEVQLLIRQKNGQHAAQRGSSFTSFGLDGKRMLKDRLRASDFFMDAQRGTETCFPVITLALAAQQKSSGSVIKLSCHFLPHFKCLRTFEAGHDIFSVNRSPA